MTATEQIPFEALDTPDTQTPAWEAARKQRGETKGDNTIPRGTYEATLIESTLVRRKDGGGWVIRLVAQTDRLGKYLVAWRGLSTDPQDPYELTDGQVKGLRKFAGTLGIPVPAPAQQIFHALQSMVGGPVMAKVTHTPVGIQAVFFREQDAAAPSPSTSLRVAGAVIEVNGQVIESESGEVMEGKAADAFAAHSKIVGGQSAVRAGLAAVAQGCHALRESRGWLALGCETLNEYLAQPDVELSKSEFERAADIWQTYVLDGGAEPVLLSGASPTKLEVPLPALKQGVVSAEQAAADAESMTRRDLRDHYRALLGTEDDPDPEPEPRMTEVWDGAKAHSGGYSGDEDGSRRRDVEGAVKVVDGSGDLWLQRSEFDEIVARACDAEVEVERLVQAQLDGAKALLSEMTTPLDGLMGAAKGAVATLRRVLDEIGDPKQKRMGKELRAAVQAALELAAQHGLDAEASE